MCMAVTHWGASLLFYSCVLLGSIAYLVLDNLVLYYTGWGDLVLSPLAIDLSLMVWDPLASPSHFPFSQPCNCNRRGQLSLLWVLVPAPLPHRSGGTALSLADLATQMSLCVMMPPQSLRQEMPLPLEPPSQLIFFSSNPFLSSK